MYYQHHIASKTKNQVCEIYQELCKEYDEVTPYVGRFKGCSEYHGYFLCKNKKKQNDNANDEEYLTEHWLFKAK